MKISTGMVKGIVILIGAWFVLTPLAAFAANKVVVIPLFGSEQLKNVIIVAPANANFTDPVAAVESVGSSASASNPYMVVIRPGVYTITRTLVMKPYVDIVGSGESVTKITGAISGAGWDTALIKGANNAVLSSLTIENTGGGGEYSIALYNDNTSPRVFNVTAKASGGNDSIAIENASGAATVLTNVTAEGSGYQTSYGVFNWGANGVVMDNVTARASGGSSWSCGIYHSGSIAVMNNVTTIARAGAKNYGIWIYGLGVEMNNVTAIASGGSYSCGVYNNNYDYRYPTIIRRSTMKGDSEGLKTIKGTATLTQSTIWWGAPVEEGGTHACFLCDNGSGKVLNSDCTEPP